MGDRRTGPLTARVFNVEHPFVYVEVSAPGESGPADNPFPWKDSLGLAVRLGEDAFIKLTNSPEATPPCVIVDVPPATRGNILPKIEGWEQDFARVMERNTDFTREDENFWTMDKKMVVLIPAAKVLYHEDRNGKPGAYLWMRLHLLGSDTPVEDLKSLLKALGYKHFRDEDASNGMFTRCDEAYCYISPEWRSGWFENHALTEGGNGQYFWRGEPCESEGT